MPTPKKRLKLNWQNSSPRTADFPFPIKIFLKRSLMLPWALLLLVFALIAGVLGFGGIAAAAASIAKILFWVLIVLFLLALVFGRSLEFSQS